MYQTWLPSFFEGDTARAGRFGVESKLFRLRIKTRKGSACGPDDSSRVNTRRIFRRHRANGFAAIGRRHHVLIFGDRFSLRVKLSNPVVIFLGEPHRSIRRRIGGMDRCAPLWRNRELVHVPRFRIEFRNAIHLRVVGNPDVSGLVRIGIPRKAARAPAGRTRTYTIFMASSLEVQLQVLVSSACWPETSAGSNPGQTSTADHSRRRGPAPRSCEAAE